MPIPLVNAVHSGRLPCGTSRSWSFTTNWIMQMPPDTPSKGWLHHANFNGHRL